MVCLDVNGLGRRARNMVAELHGELSYTHAQTPMNANIHQRTRCSICNGLVRKNASMCPHNATIKSYDVLPNITTMHDKTETGNDPI